MHDSCSADSNKEDAAAEASTAGAKLGRDEIKPGQGHGVLGD